MYQDLENKVVIVTGSGSGIGKAYAEAFGKAKAKVVLNYRSSKHEPELEKLKKEIEDTVDKLYQSKVMLQTKKISSTL